MFDILFSANLAAKPSKCYLGFSDLSYLGHKFGHGKLETDPELLSKIQQSEKPTTKKETRSFLGPVGYYRSFIPNFAEIAKEYSQGQGAVEKVFRR